MTKSIKALLLLTLILGACSPSLIPTATTPPTRTPSLTATQTPQPTETVINSETPIPQTDCAYQWAYSNLPSLTEQFDQSVKTLNPNSTSRATAFGENCIAADGQVVRFSAMETDFYVTLSVTDLKNFESFGNWITQVMQIITNIPPNTLSGPNPGFVEFHFEKNSSENINVRISIKQYNETAKDKTGEELFRIFYTEP